MGEIDTITEDCRSGRENYINGCKRLSAKYKPAKVKYLLIGESIPDQEENYFYREETGGNQTLFDSVIEAFRITETDKMKKLEKLKSRGFYLIDAVEFPINTDKIKALKKKNDVKMEIIKKEYGILKEKLEGFKDVKILLMSKNVQESIRTDVESLGIGKVDGIISPFHREERKDEFIKKMRKFYELDKPLQ